MTCDVIATGSRGNAVLLDGRFLFDCGVPFSKVKPFIRRLQAVFLTHIHLDHFRKRTIHEIHRRRPAVRFFCGKHLLVPLVSDAGVDPSVIVVVPDGHFDFCGFPPLTLRVIRFDLIHNVENCGWIVEITDPTLGTCESAMYATDTHHIPIAAPGLDLYMVESNYRTEELAQRRQSKQQTGDFSYEDRVEAVHMAHETVTAWLSQNASPTSRVIFLHGHIEGKEDARDGY